MHNEQIIHEINNNNNNNNKAAMVLELFVERRININRNQRVFFIVAVFHSECICVWRTLEGGAAGSTINGEEQHNQSEIGLSVCSLYKTTNSRAGGWLGGCAAFSHVTGRSLSTPTECRGADFRL